MWQASFRAPLAHSVERWSFDPTVKGSSPLWGEKYPFSQKWKQEKKKLRVDERDQKKIKMSGKSITVEKSWENVQNDSNKQGDNSLSEHR